MTSYRFRLVGYCNKRYVQSNP